MEAIFASMIERKFLNRELLTGSFCPIYGFGVILIVQSSEWINIVLKNFTSLIIGICDHSGYCTGVFHKICLSDEGNFKGYPLSTLSRMVLGSLFGTSIQAIIKERVIMAIAVNLESILVQKEVNLCLD